MTRVFQFGGTVLRIPDGWDAMRVKGVTLQRRTDERGERYWISADGRIIDERLHNGRWTLERRYLP